MKRLITAFFALNVGVFPAYAINTKPNNDPIVHCKEVHNYNGIDGTTSKNMMLFAACISEIRSDMRRQKETELWEFLKKNPHYRYPGMALPAGAQRPLDKCWGQTKTYGTGTGAC